MFKKILLAGVAASSFSKAEPALSPCCSEATRCSDSLFVEADILAWVAKQEGNDYATTGNGITVPGTTDPNTGLVPGPISSGKVYAPNPKAAPGFKAGLGVNLVHGNWDLFGEYTYLFNKSDGSVSSTDLNTGILPVYSYTPHNSILSTAIYFATAGGTGFVSRASSYWSLHYNNINLELRKETNLSPTPLWPARVLAAAKIQRALHCLFDDSSCHYQRKQ